MRSKISYIFRWEWYWSLWSIVSTRTFPAIHVTIGTCTFTSPCCCGIRWRLSFAWFSCRRVIMSRALIRTMFSWSVFLNIIIWMLRWWCFINRIFCRLVMTLSTTMRLCRVGTWIIIIIIHARLIISRFTWSGTYVIVLIFVFRLRCGKSRTIGYRCLFIVIISYFTIQFSLYTRNKFIQSVFEVIIKHKSVFLTDEFHSIGTTIHDVFYHFLWNIILADSNKISKLFNEKCIYTLTIKRVNKVKIVWACLVIEFP